MKYIVQFGAGNIGRSLVGSVFSGAGYEVVFVDAQQEIVNALNNDRQYRILIKENEHPEGIEKVIRGVRGLNASDTQAVAEDVAGADYVCTAVGARALPLIIPSIARGLLKRSKPLSVILCENLHNASKLAHQYLNDFISKKNIATLKVGFAETSIGKMVPIMSEKIRKETPLEVWAEPYNTIIADGESFIEKPPAIEGLSLKDNFQAWVERKLYIHNLGHAACAWHGYQHGKELIWQCLEDPWIYAEARAVMKASAEALAKKYSNVFTEDDLNDHIDDLLHRFGNRALGDSVFRVGRDLTRKLAPTDRAIGALRLCIEQGVDPEHVCRTIAAALSFRAKDETGKAFEGDCGLINQMDNESVWAALNNTCGLNLKNDMSLLERIVSRYAALCPA